MNKRFVSLFLAALLLLSMQTAALAEFIYGYFRYTVEDRSVTITAYTGRESVVTVPAMIGGNPVNAIAPGAFAGSGVRTVYLPDPIVSVAEGAFDPGQSAVHGGEADAPGSDTPAGIRDGNGDLITTDDEGNLILVDAEGNETVLDASQDYSRETGADGGAVIRGGNGEPVSVLESGEISFTGADGRPVTVPVGADGARSFEEADAEDTVMPEAAPATETPAAADQTGEIPFRVPLLLALAALMLLLCAIRVSARRRRKKKR